MLELSLGPIVSIDYLEERGLVFDWNFKGIQNSQLDNTNVFIFAENFERARNFFKDFFKEIKNGSIIGIMKPSSEGQKQARVEWIEKTTLHSIQGLITEKDLIKKNIEQQILLCFKSLRERKGFSFVNVLIGENEKKLIDDEKILERVDRKVLETREDEIRRNSTIINFIMNTNQLTKINCLSGVNIFNYSSSDPNQVFKNLKNYWKSLVLKTLTIQITLSQGQIFETMNSQSWKAIDFHTVRKQYFSIPALNFQESFIFQQKNRNELQKVCFELQINYTMPNGASIYDHKEIIFEQDHGKVYQMTSNMNKAKQNYRLMGWADKGSFFVNLGKKNVCFWVISDKEESNQ